MESLSEDVTFYDTLNSRGRERFESLCREVAQGEATCQRCYENGSVWDDGTKSVWFGDTTRKKLGGVPPFDVKATCVVWQRDPRVMIDLSHLEPSCEYHIRYRPYWGDERYAERKVVWRPSNAGS